jgi:hypothetical protein
MQINKNTNSFSFTKVAESENSNGLRNYYPDIREMGKHYTFAPKNVDGSPIREIKNRVLRRHYTIANSMNLNFYKSLVQALGQSSDSFDQSLIGGEECQSVNVGVKTYGLEKGVSRRIFDNELK